MLKDLIKKIHDFTYSNGYEISRVFDDFLTYIICFHSISPKPNDNWKYPKEQNKDFWEMYQTLILTMNEELKHKEWFDCFGSIYEELIAGKSRRSNSGQFFTPTDICNLMTEITYSGQEKITGKRVMDCACGSGRTLLSFHAKFPGNFCFGEDIDRTCAMMCVCNFILHGVVGEVVWHDSLNPTNFFGAWRINESLNKIGSPLNGLPHVREIPWDETFCKKSLDNLSTSARVTRKLREQAEECLSALKRVREGKTISDEKKRLIREITHRYNNIKKLIKRYE